MFTLITLLVLSLSIPFLGNITQSTYGKIVFSVSQRWKENRSIVNVLNWMQRHFYDIAENKIKPELKKDAKSKSRDENAEARIRGNAVLRIVHILVGNSFGNMIELWNPSDKDKQRLFGKRHVAKLEKGEETDYKKGGISPFSITQVAYAIGNEYVDRNGNAVGSLEEENDSDNVTLRTANGIIDLHEYRNGNANEVTQNFVNELFDIADAYNSEKDKAWLKRQEESDSETENEEPTAEREQVDSEFTVDDYLNGEISPNEIENVDLLNQFRDNEDVTGAKQGALTRRINELS